MKRLGGTDALFLSLETPEWHQHIGGLTVFDPSDSPGFGFDRAVEVLEERLELAPKFRWRLKTVPFDLDRPVWIEDESFDLSRHVHRVGVPAPGGQRETAQLVGQIMTHQLDRRRPLWEYWFLEGLVNGRMAAVLKFHHALLDGVSGASLSTVLLDMEPNAPMQEPPDDLESAGPEPSDVELMARSVVTALRTPGRIVQYSGRLLRRGATMLDYMRRHDDLPSLSGPRVSWNHKIGARRAFALTSISLDDVKALKEHFGVKVNDVALAICSGALRSFLDELGELPEEESLVAGVPISTRAEGDTALDNQIANMMVTLATDVDDPAERLRTIHRSSTSAKEMTEAVRAKKIQSIGETAPPLMLNLAVRSIYGTNTLSRLPTVQNLVISNVPGPPFPLYFGGARVTGIYPGSIIVDGQGLNITLFSYTGRIDFGIACDPDLVDDPWVPANAIHKALAELMAAADLGEPTPVEDSFGETAGRADAVSRLR